MRIQHNIQALNAHRQMGVNNTATSKNLEKLSSGYRINRAGDDAAGLAISEKMRSQIRGLEQATRNSQDGVSLIQTAEGALQETEEILQRMRELAVQSSNGIYDEQDRAALDTEVQDLKSEVDRISTATTFNGIELLDGSLSDGSTAATIDITAQNADGENVTVTATSLDKNADQNGIKITFAKDGTNDESATWANDNELTIKLKDAGDYDAAAINDIIAKATGTRGEGIGSVEVSFTGTINGAKSDTKTGTLAGGVDPDATKGVTFQIGANGSADQRVTLNIDNMGTTGLKIDALDIKTSATANGAIDTIDKAIETVSMQRAKLGGLQNRLEHTINNLGVTTENLTASESRIRDVDMAEEMTKFTKNNILQQAAQSMLAQANQLPQNILQLLR